MGLVKDWSSIKSRHKELNDTAKFKPDLGAILGKYEENLRQREVIADKANKLYKLEKDIRTWQTETSAKIRGLKAQFVDIGDGWTGSTSGVPQFNDLPQVSSYAGSFSGLVDNTKIKLNNINTALDERRKILDPLCKQYASLSKAIDEADKKRVKDFKAIIPQMLAVINTYENVAKQMKADAVYKSLTAFHAQLPGVTSAAGLVIPRIAP
jgi:hypothetical protein